MNEAQSSKKISVGLVLSWIFGVLFGLTGIISVFSEPIQGIVMLVMAAVLLPPVNKLVDEKWKFHLSSGIKAVVIIIGLIIFGATVDTSSTTKQQNNQPQTQQEQKQAISKDEQPKDESKPTEEQPKAINNEQPAKTEKTEIIPPSGNEIKSKSNYQLSDEAKNLAISGIKNYDEVTDAAIVQDDKTLSLVLIVRYSTNKEKAKKLGENFIRMVKTFSDDNNPGKEIGSGEYDYLITVAYPNQSVIAQGAKARISNHISW